MTEENIQKIEGNIHKIELNVNSMASDVKHIIEKLGSLSCVAHNEKIIELDKKADRVITAWAVVNTIIILAGVIVGIYIGVKGQI